MTWYSHYSICEWCKDWNGICLKPPTWSTNNTGIRRIMKGSDVCLDFVCHLSTYNVCDFFWSHNAMPTCQCNTYISISSGQFSRVIYKKRTKCLLLSVMSSESWRNESSGWYRLEGKQKKRTTGMWKDEWTQTLASGQWQSWCVTNVLCHSRIARDGSMNW